MRTGKRGPRPSAGRSDITITSVARLMLDPIPVQQKALLAALTVVIVLTGIGARLGGMSLAMLLHFIQRIAFGYSVDAVISQESFLRGVSASSPMRRVLMLATCGLVAGVGGWAVHRFGRPLVSIKKAVRADDPRMPVIATAAHALLQIITVALGSPLRREVAPREIGATLAGWLSYRAGLPPEVSRITVACGAGAVSPPSTTFRLAGRSFSLRSCWHVQSVCPHSRYHGIRHSSLGGVDRIGR